MSDNEQLDVLIAVYLIPDLAQEDFDAYTKLAGDGEIATDGVALVLKDAEGEVHVQETGDHLGRKGAEVGAGAGLVVGLFAPPLLAATALGAAAGGLAGKFARHRVKAGIGDKLDDPHVDRPDRQGVRRRAQGGPAGGLRRARGLKPNSRCTEAPRLVAAIARACGGFLETARARRHKARVVR
jgi:hypothetical protein